MRLENTLFNRRIYSTYHSYKDEMKTFPAGTKFISFMIRHLIF